LKRLQHDQPLLPTAVNPAKEGRPCVFRAGRLGPPPPPVKQQCHDQDEPTQHVLVAGAKQRRQISHWAKVRLDSTALAVHNSLLDLQVGEGLRLDRELVGKAVALGLPSFVRGGAIGDRRRGQGDGTELNDDGGRGVEKVARASRATLRADQNVSSCRRTGPIGVIEKASELVSK
jgi:hypothetical protein